MASSRSLNACLKPSRERVQGEAMGNVNFSAASNKLKNCDVEVIFVF